jgi:hypothetical protein
VAVQHGHHGHHGVEGMGYDEIASSWSNMPNFQMAGGGGGVCGGGDGVAVSAGIPIPAQPRGAPGRGILGVGSVERADALMGGMSLGTSLGAGDGAPGSVSGFLFGRGDGFHAASPGAMDFSPSNFLTHGGSPRGR